MGCGCGGASAKQTMTPEEAAAEFDRRREEAAAAREESVERLRESVRNAMANASS